MVRVKLPEHVQKAQKSKRLPKNGIKDDPDGVNSVSTSTQDWSNVLQQNTSSMSSNQAVFGEKVVHQTRSYSAANLYASARNDPVVTEGAIRNSPMSSSAAVPPPLWTHESYKNSSATQPAMVYFASIEDDLEARAHGSVVSGASLRPSAGEKQEKPPIDFQSDEKANQPLSRTAGIETKALKGIYPHMMRRKQTARKAMRRNDTVKANAKGKIVKP